MYLHWSAKILVHKKDNGHLQIFEFVESLHCIATPVSPNSTQKIEC